MPIRTSMTWEASKRHWRKLDMGKMYTISCRQLHAPETKEASYQAASRWCLTKKAEIDADHPHRLHDDILSNHEFRRDLALAHSAAPEAYDLDQEIALVRAMEDEGRHEIVQALP